MPNPLIRPSSFLKLAPLFGIALSLFLGGCTPKQGESTLEKSVPADVASPQSALEPTPPPVVSHQGVPVKWMNDSVDAIPPQLIDRSEKVKRVPREHKTAYSIGDFSMSYTIHQDGKVSMEESLCVEAHCYEEGAKPVRKVFTSKKDCHGVGKVDGGPKAFSVSCIYTRVGQVIESDGKPYVYFSFPDVKFLEPLRKLPDGRFEVLAAGSE